MAHPDRGPLLYAYRPIPANPMTVAVLLLGLVVTFLIGPIAAGPEGLWPLGGLCFLPLAVVLAAMAVYKPSPTFVFENGIEISLPLWRRIRGARRYYPWSEIRDIYPRSYEVAGSFLSPFASSRARWSTRESGWIRAKTGTSWSVSRPDRSAPSGPSRAAMSRRWRSSGIASLERASRW